jgi:hypothetical protein
MIDAQNLDYYHRLERARIHLLLIGEAEKGLTDEEAGRVTEARSVLLKLKKRRKFISRKT